MYNSYLNSATSCSGRNKCICLASTVSECSHIEGTVANEHACTCGSGVICGSDTGLYCTASSSTCSKGDTCTNVKGISLNDKDCACGADATSCNFETGRYCHAEYSRCSRNHVCPHADASNANNGTCWCGTNICDDQTGLYCSWRGCSEMRRRCRTPGARRLRRC